MIVSYYEITPSYTIETLQSLREEFPLASLNLILGWDAFQDLHRWHRWQELIEYTNFVVVNRADVESELNSVMQGFVAEHLITRADDITEFKKRQDCFASLR